MNEYLTTQQLLDELQKRLDHDSDVSEELAAESNELQRRIDKAIEYINEEVTSNWVMYGRSVLLDILKGSDSND